MNQLYQGLQAAQLQRSDLVIASITLSPDQDEMKVIYLSSLVNESGLTLCLPQILSAWGTGTGPLDEIRHPLKVVTTMDQSISFLLAGHVILCQEAREFVVALPLTSPRNAQGPEAIQEALVQGPRQAFSGDFLRDIGSLRRYLRNWNLHIYSPSSSSVSLLYLENRCIPSIQRASRLALRSFLQRYPDPIPGPAVAQLIAQAKGSFFPIVLQVERIDRLVEALQDGKAALHVSGSPELIIGPCRYIDFVRTADDDYFPSIVGPVMRWVRYIAFIFSQTLLPLWVSTLVHFPENIPRDLLLSVARLREHLPLPALAESLVFVVIFEVLFEVSLRLPKPIGQVTGVVGGFVLGQALVAAGIMSSLMLSVVSIAFLASYAVPNVQMSRANRLISTGVLLVGGLFGLIGITTSLVCMLAHKASMRVWGVDYGSPVAPLQMGNLFNEVIWRRPQPQLRARRGAMR